MHWRKSCGFDSRLRYVTITKYDRDTLSWIFGLATLVIAIILVAAALDFVTYQWLVMPMAWTIGALMAWGHSKYERQKNV